MAFNIVLYAYAIIGHTRADQLLPQLLNICMKEFGSEKIIFDKMTAVRPSVRNALLP